MRQVLNDGYVGLALDDGAVGLASASFEPAVAEAIESGDCARAQSDPGEIDESLAVVHARVRERALRLGGRIELSRGGPPDEVRGTRLRLRFPGAPPAVGEGAT